MMTNKENRMGIPEKAERIVSWIREQVGKAGAKGCVVGLSGGIDSALVAALCLRAFPETTMMIAMPCESNPKDREHAVLVAKALGVEAALKTVDLSATFQTLKDALPYFEDKGLMLANIKARLRMTTLYAVANAYNGLVMGTDNADESYVGYFTKYGDGGVDLLPISNLLKREVREMSRFMGVPEEVITKAPSAGLWDGQTDEGEMGFTYDMLDLYLEDPNPFTAIERGVPAKVVDKIERMHACSEHKRHTPPSPKF